MYIRSVRIVELAGGNGIKTATTFMAIGRQFTPSWLYFSQRPND
jgi:hypothetical protein